MLKRLVFLCVLVLLSSTSALGQNINDFLQMFGGVMQQAMRQAAQAEWAKDLPPSELSCLDQSLRQQGASVDALVGRGVSPSDPRLAQLRSNCRSQIVQNPQPPTAQPSPYVVDGLALGGQVRFESEAYKQYHCTPSDKFPGFTWCHKEKTEKAKGGETVSSNSILHSQDGTAVYVNRYIEPAFFGPKEVQTEIDRLSARFGERAREFRMPPRDGLPNAIIAVWGKIELEQLDATDVSIVASGGSHKGLLVSFLGDLERSAKAAVPVYQLAGGAGFLWVATFNQEGRGLLRFLTIDASQIARPVVAQNKPAPPPQAPALSPTETRTYVRPPTIFPSTPSGQADTSFSASGVTQLPSTRTVEVTASGDTADAAQKEAAREAVQQVAGVFIDDRRRVEINMSDQKVHEIVEEKLLTYTNAYVSEFAVISSENNSAGYTIKARVTVAVAPLLKTLQANDVPTTRFDSNSAAATATTLADEKKNALQIYRDLVARLDSLVQIGIGKAEVSPSIPSAPDSTWISVPITFFANEDAAQEWRKKFELIADKHARIVIEVVNGGTFAPLPAGCALPQASAFRTMQTFLMSTPGSGETGVAACFISGATSVRHDNGLGPGLIADCFGRAFVLQTTARVPVGNDTDISVAQRAALVRLVVNFIDKNGSSVYSLETPFSNFPSMAIRNSQSAPKQGQTAFFNYCGGNNQSVFFLVHTSGPSLSPTVGVGSIFFGDTIIFPPPGSRISAFFNVLLPNDKISQIDKIQASIRVSK